MTFPSGNRIINQTTTYSEWTDDDFLPPGTDYTWRVRREDGQGKDGPWSAGPTYLFTKLNDVKPAMIAEATANARAAAAQFAQEPLRRDGFHVVGPVETADAVWDAPLLLDQYGR